MTSSLIDELKKTLHRWEIRRISARSRVADRSLETSDREIALAEVDLMNLLIEDLERLISSDQDR